jgi:hypothetical protein
MDIDESHRLVLRIGPHSEKLIKGGGILTHKEYDELRVLLEIN